MSAPGDDKELGGLEIDVGPLTELKLQDRATYRLRAPLAFGVMALLGAAIIFGYLAAALAPTSAATIGTIATNAIHDLQLPLGVVIGFYFGTRK
jgi:hypothetical protein